MRSRLSLVLLAALISVVSHAAPLTYQMISKGEKIGTLVLETSGNETDGFVDESTVTMKQGEKTVTLFERVKYGKDGIVTSKTMTFSLDSQDAKATANFSDDGAKVSLIGGDQKDEKEVPLATKLSRVDETNFWFKSVVPEVGKKVSYQGFDMQTLTWSDVTHTYVGKSKVKIGDEERELYQINREADEDKSTIYLDDKGDPVLIVEGDMRIERVKEVVAR